MTSTKMCILFGERTHGLRMVADERRVEALGLEEVADELVE